MESGNDLSILTLHFYSVFSCLFLLSTRRIPFATPPSRNRLGCLFGGTGIIRDDLRKYIVRPGRGAQSPGGLVVAGDGTPWASGPTVGFSITRGAEMPSYSKGNHVPHPFSEDELHVFFNECDRHIQTAPDQAKAFRALTVAVLFGSFTAAECGLPRLACFAPQM